MISITPLALEKLETHLTDQKAPLTVRIFLPSSGCGDSSQLELTVDSPNDNDFTSTQGKLTLSISRKLMSITGDVKIDFKEDGFDSGFVVEADKILPIVGESDCSSCCGCG